MQLLKNWFWRGVLPRKGLARGLISPGSADRPKSVELADLVHQSEQLFDSFNGSRWAGFIARF